MVRETESGSAPPEASPFWPDCLITGALLLFLTCLAGTTTSILFLDGRESVILIALMAGAFFWGLEHLEDRYSINVTRAWNPLPGNIVPVAVISFATLAVCVPTLNSYFSGDEFAYIPLFHNLTLSQFLRLFHTDLSQGVLGWNPRELRPFYGLSYRLSYSLWGLHPLGYHLTSVLLHVINSVMVFLIARKLVSGESWRAGFAGLLFAVLSIF
jgi:hypothetical protein